MPRKSKIKNQKDIVLLEEEENLLKTRGKREASKGVQKLLSNIKGGNDIISDEENEEEEMEKSPESNSHNRKKNIFHSVISNVPFNTSVINNLNNNQQEKKSIYIWQILNSIPNNENIIINKLNIERKFNNRNMKFELTNDTYNLINHYLIIYLKKSIEKLININRIRNVNFNLFSKNSIPSYKIQTYNWDKNQENQNITFSQAKNFNIIFTNNIKKKFEMIEEYQELNNKKIKLEGFSIYKQKLEESAKEKGGEPTIKIIPGPIPIKLGPGRRTRKRVSAIIKTMRNNFVKSQKKEDLNKQKSFTMNTLDTILYNNRSFSNSNLNKSESFQRDNTHFDTFSKVSESIHSNFQNENFGNNEISINVFKSNDIKKNAKLIGTSRKKINLKDFIFFLENELNVPLKMLLLQKAMVKLAEIGNKNSH